MKAVLLVDFGSTYTKVTAVDVENHSLLGTADSYTTVQTDVFHGLENALAKLEQKTGLIEYADRLACSSAAGGLRMVVSGLVPELTAEAAKMACLGAGAKVIKVFSYQLTEEDLEEIDAIAPDIFLLTGGTDGGNQDCIIHNANMLAGCEKDFPILFAGNRSAAQECLSHLENRQVLRCENVMPKIGRLAVDAAQEKIRDLFLKRIVKAKGLSKMEDLISGILMPTPSAVLKAMELLARGTPSEKGLGELLAVDVGGATTDIYSMADGSPRNDATLLKGLPEPYSKRTVEGDIGMRYSAGGILEAAGTSRLAALSGLTPEKVEEMVQYIETHTDVLPHNDELENLDYALAAAAIETAAARHAGSVEEVFTPLGKTMVQTGKDLTGVKTVVLTGGAVIRSKRAGEIASHALASPQNPFSLRPVSADILIDRNYILAAMGLLGEKYPDCALSLMKKELENYGY